MDGVYRCSVSFALIQCAETYGICLKVSRQKRKTFKYAIKQYMYYVYIATFVVLPQLFMCTCLYVVCVSGIALHGITRMYAHKACFETRCSDRS